MSRIGCRAVEAHVSPLCVLASLRDPLSASQRIRCIASDTISHGASETALLDLHANGSYAIISDPFASTQSCQNQIERNRVDEATPTENRDHES